MCSSKQAKSWRGSTTDVMGPAPPVPIAQIDGRPVLQPAGNRVVPTLDRRNSLKKTTNTKLQSPPTPPPLSSTTSTKLIKPSSSTATSVVGTTTTSSTPPISPNPSKSPRPTAVKRTGNNDPNGLNSSLERALSMPRPTVPKLTTPTLVRKKSKKSINYTPPPPLAINTNGNTGNNDHLHHHPSSPATASSLSYLSSLILECPGSIATARREQMTLLQAQRKMKIAHYGRSKSANFERTSSVNVAVDPLELSTANTNREKRCTFITPNSDPLYIAYHDEEWGVPLHDDKLLFEMLVLSGAQVGSDWTSILKKRQDFREAFSGFDAEMVANMTERQITSISANYSIELSRVRGVVDNSNRILEIQREFGSFDKYLWGFVNHKPILTQYKSCHKIPVKTSKSETISKDMVRRGFRSVGPTVMHSFMQAAGLTNDHLTTCPRYLQCLASSSLSSSKRISESPTL